MRETRIIPRSARATALAALVLAAASCGEGPTFTAAEFVTGITRQGVELRLGEPLVTDEEGKELYAIELEPLGGRVADSKGDPAHAGGSISVYGENEGEPDAELERCEQAADLLCYRADNVVVVLEGGGIAARQLGVAMERLTEEQ